MKTLLLSLICICILYTVQAGSGPNVIDEEGIPAIMLTFTSTASTPQQTDGTLGTITVSASGMGKIEYKKGLTGTWSTSGYFTGLTAGTYKIYARDAVNTSGIYTSVTVDYIVTIPDANFKTALLSTGSVNTNSDGEIQVAEAEACTGTLSVSGQGISDMTGLESFVNITALVCNYNSISELDVEPNTVLEHLYCDNNSLTELDVSNNEALDVIWCHYNSLTSLNVKNGGNLDFTAFKAYENDLTCITVDDPDYSRANWTEIDVGVTFSLDCEDSQPVISDVDKTDINGCYGDLTGEITITVTGGVGSKTYSIDDGDTWQTSNTFSDLAVGDYYVKAKDENGFLASWAGNPVNITEPDMLEFDEIVKTEDNGTGNGSITLTIIGGTLPYEYKLDDGTWQSSNIFSSLSIGIYTVYVRDNNLCIESTNVEVTGQAPVYIPDENFELYLLNNTSINTVYDGVIQVSEAEAFTGTIDVEGWGIEDLTGIEAFVNLTRLLCNDNSLTTIDVSSNTALTSLECKNNLLTSLDVTNNTLLLGLKFSGNSVTSIDVSNCPSLINLFCSNNSLTNLDISENTALYNLYCEYNSLTTLDVSFNTALRIFLCSHNLISSLDLSGKSNLVTFECTNNNITTLDISDNTSLNSLNCSNNPLSGLDLSNNGVLTYLNCTSTLITLFDLSHNSLLMHFQCTDSPVTSLDFSSNPSLKYLYCSGASLTEVDLRNGANGIISNIDFTNNPELWCVNVDDAGYAESNWADDFDAGIIFSIDCDAEDPVPEHDTIAGTTFELGDSLCFGATLTITVGGEGSDFVDFEPGSSTTLIAGGSITFMPGTHIQSGSYLWAFITTDGSFCDVYGPSSVEAIAPEKSPMKYYSLGENTSSEIVNNSTGKEMALKVYPNPNNGQFNIEITGFGDPVELFIINSLGVVVKRISVQGGNAEMELMGLKQGIYFVKACSNVASSARKMIIN